MAKDEATPASRRGVFKAGVAILAAGAAGAAGTAFAKAQPAPVPTRLAQTTKIAKAMLQYQDHPNAGNHCGICAQFEPPDQCKIVEGPVSQDGWCAAFAPKST
jgi:anaerobic selenocysteine-containing dehydrogenase